MINSDFNTVFHIMNYIAAVGVRSQVRSCGICVDKVALGKVFFEYLGFPCRFLFYRLLHTH
jgi:hypothetical protein